MDHISIIWRSYLGETWYWCKMYHEIAPFPPQKKNTAANVQMILPRFCAKIRIPNQWIFSKINSIFSSGTAPRQNRRLTKDLHLTYRCDALQGTSLGIAPCYRKQRHLAPTTGRKSAGSLIPISRGVLKFFLRLKFDIWYGHTLHESDCFQIHSAHKTGSVISVKINIWLFFPEKFCRQDIESFRP